MSLDRSQIEAAYSVCPLCQGTGEDQNGFACRECEGMGVIAKQNEDYYYWGVKPTLATISLNKLKGTVDFVLNFTAFLFGVAGVFALAWWGWNYREFLTDLNFLYFWTFRDPLLLVFWASLISDMFVIYRISEDLRKSHKIKPIGLNDKLVGNIVKDWGELEKVRLGHKHKVENYYYPDAISAVEDAYLMAVKLGHPVVTVKHLFFNLLRNKKALVMLFRLNINAEDLIEKLKKQIREMTWQVKGSGDPKLAPELREALIQAFFNASDLGQKRVEVVNLAYASMIMDNDIEEILYDFEIDREKALNTVKWFIINEKIVEAYTHYRRMSQYKPGTGMNRAYTAVATPILDHFGRDLTLAAKMGRLDFCVGREDEIRKAFDIIESGRNGIIFVGNPGVGKTTTIQGIAQLMVEENVPKILKDKRLIELDVARIISGGSASDAEARMIAAFDESIKSGNIILYINNIDRTIGISAGAEQSLDLSDVISGAISRREVICLASADTKNYNSAIEGKALGNAFTKVEVNEPDKNKAILMISSKIGYFEAKHNVYFTYNSIEESIKLSQKFIHDKYLPAKAIDILEITAAQASREQQDKVITKEDIAKTVSSLTHIPVSQATADEGKLLLNLEDKIHEHMIDQEEAVRMVASSLRRARAQMVEGKRPLANFLFLGPTGVGKTELAKTISRVYFGDEKYMIRVDMSEYQHPDSVSKMIGDSSGTLGYLTEAVRKAPFSLILLDEFEKAYRDILNLFLQVMDDGRLTDGQGRTVDFTNSIIIATSNVGALFIQEQIKAGRPTEEIKEELINEHLNQVLRPELINRFDGVIVFKPLTINEVLQIAKLLLNKLSRLLEEKGISLKYDEQGVLKLAEAGFKPKFSARPLRRVLKDNIEDKIANKILAGELKRRDTVIIGANAEIAVEKGREL